MFLSKKSFSNILIFVISLSSLPALASMQVLHDISFPESEKPSPAKNCAAQDTCKEQPNLNIKK